MLDDTTNRIWGWFYTLTIVATVREYFSSLYLDYNCVARINYLHLERSRDRLAPTQCQQKSVANERLA